jgi:nucleoside-diphosphate-sugar epimerase
VRNGEDLRRLQDPDYVLHLHWIDDRRLPVGDQREYAVQGSIDRIAFFWSWLQERSFKRLLNVSSIRIFAGNCGDVVKANTEPHPSTPYGEAKVVVERYLESVFNGRCMHLRLCSVASGGENETQLLTRLYTSAFQGRPIVVTRRRTHLMDIDDAVDFIIQAAVEGTAPRYNIVAPAYTNEWIAGRFEEISGRKLNAVYETEKTVDGPEFDTDVPKLAAPWMRVTPIEGIIRKVIDHYTEVERAAEETARLRAI